MGIKAASTSTRIRGIAASPGIAVGRVVLLDRRQLSFEKYHVTVTNVDREIQRLDVAIEESVAQVEALRTKFEATEGASQDHFTILEAHQLMLKDALLVQGARDLIVKDRINAEWALRKTVTHIKELFERLEEDYFRERLSDVDFVGERILRNLLGHQAEIPLDIGEAAIIVAHNLSPADTIQLVGTNVVGFATNLGSKTAHTAIVARSLEIPAVVGLKNIVERAGKGDLIIVDGYVGEVLIEPSRAEQSRYASLQADRAMFEAELRANCDVEAVSQDGATIELRGNVDFLEEAHSLPQYGGRGIGLLRTEYLFLNRSTLPSEEEQVQYYRAVIRAVAPHSTTIRTLDIGGDKFSTDNRLAEELNPFFGLRAIRYCLRERALFKTQLRALLRASAEGPMRLMVPFISCVEEITQIKQCLAETREELDADGLAFDPGVQLGVMIEIPSAAIMADVIAREVDFLSIGTNDLIQYTLAIARDSDETNYLYNPLHPAVLRLVQSVAAAAAKAGIPVAMCGEMAGDPMHTLLLLAMGFNELSMSPRSIPLVKEIVRRSSLAEARELLGLVQELGRVADVEALVSERMHARFPDLMGRRRR